MKDSFENIFKIWHWWIWILSIGFSYACIWTVGLSVFATLNLSVLSGLFIIIGLGIYDKLCIVEKLIKKIKKNE